MTAENSNQFLIKYVDAAGVESLYVATVAAKYPSSANLPADASATVKATVSKIETTLAGKSVVMVKPSGETPEGQMIEGQMIGGETPEGQMIGGSADG